MNRILICLGILIAISSSAIGQCNDCNLPVDDVGDYCYTNTAFSSMCAQFAADAKYFKFRGTKKYRTIPIGSGDDLEYLKSLTSDKKLKMSSLEILFIERALNTWSIEQRKFGYKYEDSGLGIKLINEGDGEFPEKGDKVVVHYSGYLEDGTKFDSSVDKNETFSFTLGQGRVIKGWDEAFSKIKKGSEAWLRIPPELGYGDRSISVIPANSTLYFKVELMK